MTQVHVVVSFSPETLDALRALMIFLAKDCCQGRPELCEPLLAELTCC